MTIIVVQCYVNYIGMIASMDTQKKETVRDRKVVEVMRLIDADDFIKKFRNGEADTEEEKNMNRAVRRMIREQPTAYDTDKVVEALEEEKDCGMDVIDTDYAIEIVKKGGVDAK